MRKIITCLALIVAISASAFAQTKAVDSLNNFDKKTVAQVINIPQIKVPTQQSVLPQPRIVVTRYDIVINNVSSTADHDYDSVEKFTTPASTFFIPSFHYFLSKDFSAKAFGITLGF